MALGVFERRTRQARRQNVQALRDILNRNAGTEFGHAHGFETVRRADDLVAAFRARVPLSTYEHYLDPVARLVNGEQNILTTEPVTAIVGSAGTTGHPKRLPRTAHSQRQTMFLVALAEQGVLDRHLPQARGRARGISLMSTYLPPPDPNVAVPLVSGPNAGMARVKRRIPVLWTSPAAVFDIRHQPTMLYLHALFGLADPAALYISMPFAPQLVAWFGLLERHQHDLVQDLAHGSLAAHLQLSDAERRAVTALWRAHPQRAQAVAAAFSEGRAGLIPRLWPRIQYLRTVTSGSFSLSVPPLRTLAGPDLLLYSGCHSSTEGILGINLKTDGGTDYVLAAGNAFFEFLPLQEIDAAHPRAVDLIDLMVGQDYELVLTSSAGLYRYRMGDVIRIIDWHGEAPVFNFLYRRGTILNLVGEKTTELHTAKALDRALSPTLSPGHRITEYSVAGSMDPHGVGRYTFYVELTSESAGLYESGALATAKALDQALGEINPYYAILGRQVERLAPLDLKVVRCGTFNGLLGLQRRRTGGVDGSQVKVPRAVMTPDQLALLEHHVCQVVAGGDPNRVRY